MIAPAVAIAVLVVLLSLGLGFQVLLRRQGRTEAEQAHWERWEAEVGRPPLYDWAKELDL